MQGRWNHLLSSSLLIITTPLISKWFEIVKEKYSEKQRFYHTLQHIEDLYVLYDEYRYLLHDPVVVELAIWFHDVIYDPKRNDNEEKSAQLFEEFAKEIALEERIIQQTTNFIISTKAHMNAVFQDNPDLALFLDFDLLVLAKPPQEYDTYAQQIRQEYIHYEELPYCQGRVNVLGGFLASKFIFKTNTIQQKFEERARQNLIREVAQLTAKASL